MTFSLSFQKQLTIQGSFPTKKGQRCEPTPRIGSENLKSGKQLTIQGSFPTKKGQRCEPTPRIGSENLKSGTQLTNQDSFPSEQGQSYEQTPRSQNLNSGTELTFQSSFPTEKDQRREPIPRFGFQNLNSEAELTFPSSIPPGKDQTYEPTQRVGFQNLNSGTQVTIQGSFPARQDYSHEPNPRFGQNSGAEYTFPSLQTVNSGFAGMLESVYSTPEPERVDNLESTSSAIQGAFSTLYNEDFPQATHSCHSCGNIIHQLVQDIKELRKDVDTLKKKVKKSKSQGSDIEEASYNGFTKHQLGEMVTNLTTPSDVIKCLFKALFTVEELTSSSVTGKKTVKGDMKDGLEETKRQCAEAVVQNKFPEMSIKEIRNKMRDRLKMFRRSHLPQPSE